MWGEKTPAGYLPRWGQHGKETFMQGTKENRQVATSGNQPLRREESRREEYVAPQVNIFENKEGYVLEAEMPGVNKEGLEITLEENEITIVGHRQAESTPGQPLFRERHAGG